MGVESIKQKIKEDIRKLYEESSSKEEFEQKLEQYLEFLEASGILDLINTKQKAKLVTQVIE